MKVWQKLREQDPGYRRGYVLPVCIHCSVISGLMHADSYVKGGDYVCGTCQEEGPRRTFSPSDLQFFAEQISALVQYMIEKKRAAKS